ncbi:MAG: crossover junction endodeoxyribonuclease RuvC [Saprospiraceae bacterium]
MQAQPTYRILGIDPGTNVLGYAVIEIRKKQPLLLHLGTLNMGHLDSPYLKLQHIFQGVVEIITKYTPQQMAVEAPFYGKNVQSMLKLGRAQGVAIAAGMTNGIEVTEYAPKKIKQSVTGNGNASKEQVSAMLASVFNRKMTDAGLDATDALATALCHFYKSGSVLNGKKKYSGWESFLKDNPDRQK